MIAIDLSGRKALITGGSSGIGAATSIALTRAGATCTVLDRNPPRTDVHAFVKADLRDPAEVHEALLSVGPVDILVNNAGILGTARLFDETALGDLEASWEANLRSSMLTVRALAPGMRQRGFGVVVNVSSIAGIKGSESDPSYAAMKAGLIGLTKGLALQYGRYGIRAVAVCPGTVAGGRLLEHSRGYGLTREETLGLIQRLPRHRAVQLDEVANLVAFLASPLASGLNGSMVVVDAGELSAEE